MWSNRFAHRVFSPSLVLKHLLEVSNLTRTVNWHRCSSLICVVPSSGRLRGPFSMAGLRHGRCFVALASTKKHQIPPVCRYIFMWTNWRPWQRPLKSDLLTLITVTGKARSLSRAKTLSSSGALTTQDCVTGTGPGHPRCKTGREYHAAVFKYF